ncbi:uncharacterized protein LOC62_02G002576 [Vanrija pseudolonga]|uniref:Uncharacterized protein n=1 Tax=Vanrija pseudolonga TaxID=143232 RepID=A0AAF0Y6A4_9TREE|nr:hypothetical protein LOC62_02G002576 [Vanrija pseudolonga]
MLDRTAFPHIFDLVLRHAPTPSLIRLRLVSRERPTRWWDCAEEPDAEQEAELAVVATQLARTRVLDVAGAVPVSFTRWFHRLIGPRGTFKTNRITRVFNHNDLTDDPDTWPARPTPDPLSDVLVRYSSPVAHTIRRGLGGLSSLSRVSRDGHHKVVHHVRLRDIKLGQGAYMARDTALFGASAYYVVFEEDLGAGEVQELLEEGNISKQLVTFTVGLARRVRCGKSVVLVGLTSTQRRPHKAPRVTTKHSPGELLAGYIMEKLCSLLRDGPDKIHSRVQFTSHAEFCSLFSEDDRRIIMAPRPPAADPETPAPAPASP